MRRFAERLLIAGTVLLGTAYVHGVTVTGPPLGFIQAGIAIAVIVVVVCPTILSAFRARALVELIAALLLFGASARVLHESVQVHIVGTGDARVLAVRASVTTEVVE